MTSEILEKTERNIARQKNELVNIPWRGLDAIDIDFFLAICKKINNKGTDLIILNVNEVKMLANYNMKESRKDFVKRIIELGRKINKMFTCEFIQKGEEEFAYGIYSLFPTFEFTGDTNSFRVRVNPDYAYLLNDFAENYTSVDISQLTQLESAYAKNLYVYLSKYASTGVWEVSKDEIKKYLCMPDTSSTANVKRNIESALREVTPFFQNLKYKTKYAKNTKGRPSAIGYKFTFEPKRREKSRDKLTQEEIADMTGATWTGKYCPECGEKIYSKNFTTEDGTVFPQLGHTDYKTGKCKFRPAIYELLTNEEADAKFGGKKREATKGPSEEAKEKQEQREAEIFAAEDREREAEEKALSEQQERELTEKLGRKPTEEELTEDSKRRAFEALKIYKY